MKIVREHITRFERPSSEEDFKDTLFPKKIKIIGRAPLLGYSYYIKFENNNSYFVTYDINKKTFYKASGTPNYGGLIRNLKYYNIPFKKGDKIISFSEVYVDWEEHEKPIQESIQFKKLDTEKEFKKELFSKPLEVHSCSRNFCTLTIIKNNYIFNMWYSYDKNNKENYFFRKINDLTDTCKNYLQIYNIPYEDDDSYILIKDKYVDWGEYEKSL